MGGKVVSQKFPAYDRAAPAQPTHLRLSHTTFFTTKPPAGVCADMPSWCMPPDDPISLSPYSCRSQWLKPVITGLSHLMVSGLVL